MTLTTTTGSETAQQKAEDAERRINEALHSAINESAVRNPGFTPRIESFAPAAKHISAHAQRLTTISAAGQTLEIMVIASEDPQGECRTEISIFRRSFLDPDDAPPVEIIELDGSSTHTEAGSVLGSYIEAFYKGSWAKPPRRGHPREEGTGLPPDTLLA